MSNPLGEQSNEISFEDRRQAQEETEKSAQVQQEQRYHHPEGLQSALSTTTTETVGGERAGNSISSKNLINEERIFGSQFTYRDYLFDGNSNSIISAAELQPGPSSSVLSSDLGTAHQVPETSDNSGAPPGDDTLPVHSQSALDTGAASASSLLSLSVNTSILNFALQQQPEHSILPPFSSQEAPSGGVRTSVFLIPSTNSSNNNRNSSSLVEVSSESSLPTNEYMLFGSSMLDTTTTNLSAMQETSGSPTTATSKVVEYFSAPQPLQSALPQESSNVDSLTQQQLNLESQQQHVQTQQHQESAPNFGHFRMNGNGASQHNPVVQSNEVQVPNDTNNNPISEDLKESIGSLLVNEGASSRTTNSITSSVPSSNPCNMDNQVSAGGHSSASLQQYMSSTNAGNSNGGPGQTMMAGQELGAQQQQQQHNAPLPVPSSASNDGQSNVLEMTIPSNYPCYSDEAQMQQQHAFGGSNVDQSSGHVDNQLVSNEARSLYHSHHLPPLQAATPTSSQAQPLQQSTSQHHQPIANQQINHGQQTMSLQQQQHHSQHHSMMANAPSTPSLDQYGQSQMMDTMGSSSATLQQQLQQQSSQSSKTVTVDSMLSQKTSTPQSTTVSTSSEIKSDLGSYQSTSSADTYMLQSSGQGSASAQSYHQQVPLHHGEGQMCQQESTQAPSSSSALPSSLSTSNALQQQQPLPSTAHQRTQHYMSSGESIHTSTSSNNQPTAGINSQSNGNSGGNVATGETDNGTNNGQMLSSFEQQSVSSSQSDPSSSVGQHEQQQGCFVYVKCEPGVQQNTVTHYSVESGKPPASSVQQMQYEVQSQAVQQQSTGDNSLQQMQQVPSQQQQLLNQQQSHDDVLSPSQRPPALPPSNSGAFSVQQQVCISIASNVPTSANQSGLRSVCVITDPNGGTSLSTLQQQHQHQSSSQAQVNLVAATSFSPLPPKKIRYASNSRNEAVVNTSMSQLHPLGSVSAGQQSTASTLLFASKSSVTASSVLPSPSSQTSAAPASSSASQHPNIVQTMLLPSNMAAYNQAQSLQSQQHMQSHQHSTGNIIITSPTSVPNLQNVSLKSFVPSSESAEQSYSEGNNILMQQQSGQFASTMPSASSGGSMNVSCYPTSGVSSSIQSGSQYSSRIQQIVSTASVVSSQGQIFFNNAAGVQAAAGNIRLLDPNMNYSIVSLQPATIQQGRLQAHQQQQQHQAAQATKTGPQKIMLHSVPSLESNESTGSSSAGTPTAATAATLLTLNPKFALAGGHVQGQMAAMGTLAALNNGPGQQLPTGSIILSPVSLSANNNIPASQVSRSLANFAVPIPVVTSAISGGASAVPRSQHLAISQTTLGHFGPTLHQFPGAPSASHSPVATVISNLSLPSTAAAPPPLATKSTKMPSSSKKGGNASKSSNPLGNVSISGKNIHPPPIISEDPAKPFKCVLCGKNLASKNVYQLHLRSHSGEKPFSCAQCSNRFSQKTSLTRHMRSHTGERPFPCQICNKRFADKERIKIHMRIHTGEKPFSCQICGKKFSQKSTVKRHMSVHTGVKPFKCEICGKGFANRGNLTAHTKTHQSQHANQQGRNTAGTSTSNNNNSNTNNNQQQQQQTIDSMSRQIQSSSMAPGNVSFAPNVSVVANNGIRVEIKTEVDDVSLDRKNSNPHNHQQQFTNAAMSSAHAGGSQAQQ